MDTWLTAPAKGTKHEDFLVASTTNSSEMTSVAL